MGYRRKKYTDEQLLNALSEGTLPPLDFTHEAHVRLVWLLRKDDSQQVFAEVSKMIQNYANQIGEGAIYHQTLTYAAVMLIMKRINEGHAIDFDDFIMKNKDLVDDFKTLVHQHYSEKKLQSAEAKMEIILPDKAPF